MEPHQIGLLIGVALRGLFWVVVMAGAFWAIHRFCPRWLKRILLKDFPPNDPNFGIQVPSSIREDLDNQPHVLPRQQDHAESPEKEDR